MFRSPDSWQFRRRRFQSTALNTVYGELRKVRGYRDEVRVNYAGISTNAVFQQTLARTETALSKYQ